MHRHVVPDRPAGIAHPEDAVGERGRLPPLIQAMLQPAFYQHPVEAPLSVIQTHAAYVVLTGPYAYKIKKPVNLGFLDFSTLERRRVYCLEELRLNRRTTVDLYRDVLPIRETNGAYELGAASGQIVEYALRMRQFPQHCLLSAMLDRGELTLEHASALGRQVALMHRTAETSPAIQHYGAPAAIKRVIDDNQHALHAFVGRDLTPAMAQDLQAWTTAILADHAGWLSERQAAGMIRACHGDLHLNNVCFFEGRMQPFDCIEFNPSFRMIDVLYDAAFLVMDLAVRGRSDLASEFLNTYLEQIGDYRGVRLLPLYLSMRACIRAKVASQASDDPHLPDERQAELRAQAARYYQYAWGAIRPRTGRIVITAGLSGSGKSTIARALARRDGAIQLRSDVLRKHLAGVALDQPAPAAVYEAAASQACYERLLDLGLLLATQGATVILDAKYDRRSQRAAVLGAAQAAGLPVRILHCAASSAVLRDRVSLRRGDASDATVAVLERQAFEPLTQAEQDRTIELDTTEPLDRMLARIPVD